MTNLKLIPKQDSDHVKNISDNKMIFGSISDPNKVSKMNDQCKVQLVHKGVWIQQFYMEGGIYAGNIEFPEEKLKCLMAIKNKKISTDKLLNLHKIKGIDNATDKYWPASSGVLTRYFYKIKKS